MIAIDLFCGLGGWAEGFLAEGYTVVGFDIERHDYGTGGYPGQLVLQDVLTIDGARFKDAAVIVASPPCQEFSYMAMPWTKAKAKIKAIEADPKERERLTALFNACFRIQREASAAAGHKIPLIVENVCGAQKWVGRARWHYGSYYLWGDVPALMPIISQRMVMKYGVAHRPHGATNFHGDKYVKADHVRDATKMINAIKCGGDWFNSDETSVMRRYSSKSNSRKAASAMIAKIPFPLAQHIARVFQDMGARS